MPDVAQVLKQEISRLARKEVKTAFETLKEQVSELKAELRKQKQTISSLEKALRTQKAAASSPPPAKPQPAASRVRLTPQSIKRHRLRLKLSQSDLGRILEVSTNTIVRWEAGSSQPRATHRDGLIKLRQAGIRQVKQQLAD